MHRWKLTWGCAVVGLAFVGCTGAEPDAVSPESVNTNVVLLVSNQSFVTNPVDIEVRIDGDVIVRDDFDVAGEQPPQHNWQRFGLELSEGEHTLSASSSRGDATLEVRFEVSDRPLHTATLAYWHDPSQFGQAERRFFTFEIRGDGAGVL